MTAERREATRKIDPLDRVYVLLFVCKVATSDVLRRYFLLMYTWLKQSRCWYKMKLTCSKCFER